ncbi:MAG TPA: hypothetical protein VH136_18665 [Trebonia sp.]|nr:hypothetical protein [Trebonia sp.]
MTLRDESYDAAVRALAAEPVVREMAASLLNPDAELLEPDGTPTYAFMMNARGEYEFRTGHAAAGHIGAVAEALMLIRDEERYGPSHDCPKEAFLADPITSAYGVGSEMVGSIRCAVCDAEEEGRA